MIIALDGNVCTGKTTLQQYLKNLGFAPVEEYCTFFDKTPAELPTQRRYLLAEGMRQAKLDPSRNMVLDRSFISLCAHVWAQHRIDKEDMRASFLDDLCQEVSRKSVTLPDMFVHLRCTYQNLYSRFLERETSSRALGTSRELIEPAYINEIDEFNAAWARTVPAPCLTIVTDCPVGSIDLSIILSFAKDVKNVDYAGQLQTLLKKVIQC